MNKKIDKSKKKKKSIFTMLVYTFRKITLLIVLLHRHIDKLDANWSSKDIKE